MSLIWDAVGSDYEQQQQQPQPPLSSFSRLVGVQPVLQQSSFANPIWTRSSSDIPQARDQASSSSPGRIPSLSSVSFDPLSWFPFGPVPVPDPEPLPVPVAPDERRSKRSSSSSGSGGATVPATKKQAKQTESATKAVSSTTGTAKKAAAPTAFEQACAAMRGPVVAKGVLMSLKALQEQRRVLVQASANLRGSSSEDAVRGVFDLVRALDMTHCTSHSPLVTMLGHLGASIVAAFGDVMVKAKRTQIAASEIARAACAVLDVQACKGTVFALLFNASAVTDLRRFADATTLTADTVLDVLFDPAGDAEVRVPFEVAAFAGVVDASHLPVSKLTRVAQTVVTKALAAANPIWLRALRGQAEETRDE